MSVAAIIAAGIVAWAVLIALILAFFRGAKWIDRAVDDEMNAIFSVSGGTPSPPGRGAQREE